MPRVALLASPGVGLRAVESLLRDTSGVRFVGDVEDTLVSRDALWSSPRLRRVPATKRRMRSLVEAYTRENLLHEWSNAFLTTVATEADSEDGVDVIGFHPSLYS